MPVSATFGALSMTPSPAALRKPTILFIDEIHRFNKAQQDVVLPFVEDGTVTLIGATTENPSFEVNSALLSRARCFRPRRAVRRGRGTIIDRALRDAERGLGHKELAIDDEARALLVGFANGDARAALSSLELAAASARGEPPHIDVGVVREAMQRRNARYDKSGEMHYDTISALIKSVRASDADASLYWLARLIEGGEDPLFIARRLVILASEDVGLADSNALPVVVAAQQAVHFVGCPKASFRSRTRRSILPRRRRATASAELRRRHGRRFANAQRSSAAALAKRAHAT